MTITKVPLLDLKAQFETIETEIREAIDEVVKSQHFILGKKVQECEERIADYCGCEHAVGCASGTDAILLSLMALDVCRGTAVITTPFTFFATAGCIWRLGARPVFVDIDPQTYNMDPDKLKQFIETDCELRDGNIRLKTGETVAAIMPVHLFGQCADMDPILEIATKHNIAVVEDAAQAIGSEYKGKKAGTIGDAGCFSFFPSKNLGCFGDGGMVVSNDKTLADRVRLLRTHGSERKYYHSMVGINSRLDALQAAVIMTKLPYLDNWSRCRVSNAEYYNDALKDSGIVTPVNTSYSTHIYNQYVIRSTRRDALQKHLSECGIGNAIYYPLCLHMQECFSSLGYTEGDFPESKNASKEVLALPVYPELTEAMLDYVMAKMLEFVNG